MPRGTPDGKIETYDYASQVSDLAYVNNMLWGFSPIDNQGRPVYLDTFNNGMGGWRYSTSGAGVAPTLKTGALGSRVISPPNYVEINPGIVANDMSQVFREMYMGKSLRIGIEAGFVFSDVIQQPRLSVDYNPNTYPAYFGNIFFDRGLGAWRVWVLGNTYQTFYTPGTPNAGVGMLMQIKVVMDFSTGKYVRAFVGDQNFDLSAYSMGASSSTYNGLLICAFRAVSFGATCQASQLDYILVTKDEP